MGRGAGQRVRRKDSQRLLELRVNPNGGERAESRAPVLRVNVLGRDLSQERDGGHRRQDPLTLTRVLDGSGTKSWNQGHPGMSPYLAQVWIVSGANLPTKSGGVWVEGCRGVAFGLGKPLRKQACQIFPGIVDPATEGDPDPTQ